MVGNSHRERGGKEKDPFILRCSACNEKFAARHAVEQCLTRVFTELKMGDAPISKDAVDALSWQWQSLSPSATAVEREQYWARVAALQLRMQWHDPTHRDSCFKKGTSICRYKCPYPPAKETEVTLGTCCCCLNPIVHTLT